MEWRELQILVDSLEISMCGIAGIFLKQGQPVSATERLAINTALDALRYRGPDARGYYEAASFAVGHVRLSVLDIERGVQPFIVQDRSAVLAYNGELYDFAALRSELSATQMFSTHSDTEVLAYLLESSGLGGLNRVNGMYAFAYYQVNERIVTLAVDPVGIKPLYYFQSPDFLAFCSELAPLCLLLRTVGVTVSVNKAALPDYLALGWFPAPATAIDGVMKLMPGESVRRDSAGTLEYGQRGLPSAQVFSRQPRSRGEWNGVARSVVSEAISSQLVADVPVGLFLSGGIDSSLLLALASKTQRGMMTFSVGFRDRAWGDQRFDESDAAASVAHKFGSQHHELQATPKMLIDCIDPVLEAIDEPIADPAVVPLHLLAQFASRHVKVCLSGDGGDELFGGYAHHRLRRLWLALGYVPGSGALLKGAKQIGNIGERLKLPGMRRVNTALGMLANMAIVRGPFSGTKSALLPEALRRPDSSRAESRLMSDADAMLRFELEWPLAGYMLPKSDRITMHSSLEARVPYLDNRVIALARAMPWPEKVRGSRTKAVLRDLLAEECPGDISERRKLGFRVPLDSWFRGALRARAEGCFSTSSPLWEILAGSASFELLNRHTSGSENFGPQLWALVVLDSWFRRVSSMEGSGAKSLRGSPVSPRAASRPVL